jgi:CubicO group peptidase (beta-lactamase class C family)
MSVVLAEKTGMSTLQFARENLLVPLDIGERNWLDDNRGYNYGGVGLTMTPLDMIKIGELMLNHGLYNGRRIVPENWCNESTTAQTTTNNSIPYGPSYGYYWWVGSNNGHNFYFANGYGGQFIVVVEELNLVVTAHRDFRSDWRNADNHWYTVLNTIVTEIIPAFASGE